MKFSLKDLKGSSSKELNINTDLNILDMIDYKSIFNFYQNKDFNDIYNISVNQYNVNIGIIDTFLKLNVKKINLAISNDNIIKIKSLLKSEHLPDSIIISGYKYTNLNIYFKLDLLMVSIIEILDDINEQINSIIYNNNEKEASMKIDDLNKKFEKIIDKVNDRKFYDMILFGFPDKNTKVDNKEYFRDGKSDSIQIEVKKDEYYNIYRKLLEYRRYSDNFNKYLNNLGKMSDNIGKVLYNKELKSKYNSLPKDNYLKSSLNRLILNEGKFIGHISVFIVKFISFQADATNESLKQDMYIINTINDGILY